MIKTISATKKMLAMILAVLMMFSGMAVMASAETAGENTGASATTVTKPEKPTFVLNETDKKVTITPPAGAKVSISPLPSDPIEKDNTVIYINLVPGTTYTIKAYVTDSVNEINVYSDAVTFTLKKKQEAPAAPVPEKVTSKTITVAQVTGCEYRLVELDKTTGEQKAVKYDWTDRIVVFEGLNADSPYLLSIRKKATDDKYASEAASVTVKTLKVADSVAADTPVLVDKTNTTVTVKEVTGVQFSIDNGKTWQTSGTFTGLTPNTVYGVIARKTFDKALQDPNPVSAILEIKTNTRVRYAAAPGKCTFTVAEGTIYAEKDIQATIVADGPAGSFKNIHLGEYGDTQLVPFEVVIGGRTYEVFNSKENVYTVTINPEAGLADQKDVEVTVKYRVWKHNGEVFKATDKVEESKHSIDVGAKWGVLTILSEFFTKLANLLLNTIPQYITDLFSSEAAGKLFGGIADLLGSLGKS